jgi:hypothetical protein
LEGRWAIAVGTRIRSTAARARFIALIAALAWARPAHAQQPVGDAGSALPGLVRVGAASPLDTGLVVSGLAGYGYGGAVVADSDDHHRAALDLAASFRPLSWLAIAARFSGRYDRHTDTGEGDDSGWVGDPRLTVRAARTSPLPGLWLAAQAGLWVPGRDAPSLDPGAATVDLLGLSSWSPPASRLVFSAQAGFRLDRSAESIDRPDELSPSDRMALGVSESDAFLVGAGAALRSGATEWVGEWSWDVLVGDRAPERAQWPMRLAAGARHRLTRALSAQLIVEYSLAERPELDVMGALFPIEPRFQALAGLTFQTLGAREPPAPRLVAAPAPKAAPRPGAGGITVAVAGGDGTPVNDAEVEVQGSADGARAHKARTGADGRTAFAGVASGPAQIQVRHPQYMASAKTVEVAAGRIAQVSFTLDPALPPGQLRGVVRSFQGRPLAAKLKITPIGLEASCDKRGEFEIDLPPGEYEVSVDASGYRAQRRRVQIEKDGVTILNVDLRK